MAITEDDYAVRGWSVVQTADPVAHPPGAVTGQLSNHPEAAGESSWGTRNILHAFILSMRPKVVLEVGALIGSMSVVIGSALRANNFGKLFCLDPASHTFPILQEHVEAAGLDEWVRPLKMKSTDLALPGFLGEPVDMAFLDANHAYTHARRDLEIIDALLAPGGVIFLDDTGTGRSADIDPEGRGGVRQALLDFASNHPDYAVTFFDPPFWLNPGGMAMAVRQSADVNNHKRATIGQDGMDEPDAREGLGKGKVIRLDDARRDAAAVGLHGDKVVSR